jgi:hypothetical protein
MDFPPPDDKSVVAPYLGLTEAVARLREIWTLPA